MPRPASQPRAPRCSIRCCIVFLGLVFLTLPLPAQEPDVNAYLQQIQTRAEALKAQADACANAKCPVSDCASLAKMTQALIDAETVLDALHNALIEQDSDMRAHHSDLYSNSHLTGTKLAQLQNSLAWQEYFHQLGSYSLKVASMVNFLDGQLNKFDAGTNSTGMTKMEALQQFDSTANFAKNLFDFAVLLQQDGAASSARFDVLAKSVGLPELPSQFPSGEFQVPENLKSFFKAWDVKSEVVDYLKLKDEVAKADKKFGVDEAWEKFWRSRNLLNLFARALKMYSESLIQAEKEVLKQLSADQEPEAKALIEAYKEWQKVRARMFAAEDALGAIRGARTALGACMAKANCGSKTLSRRRLPDHDHHYGDALRDLEPELPKVSAGLNGSIGFEDKCNEPGTTQPSKTGTEDTAPAPKNVVENDCPLCSGIALELARTLDERDFSVQELRRIRANLEQASSLERDAELLQATVKRITKQIQEFREKLLAQPHIQIDIEALQRERLDRQNTLRALQQKIKALRAEEEQVRPLENENSRLYELSEKLKPKLSQCQKRCTLHEERVYLRAAQLLDRLKRGMETRKASLQGLVGKECMRGLDENGCDGGGWQYGHLPQASLDKAFSGPLEIVNKARKNVEDAHEQMLQKKLSTDAFMARAYQAVEGASGPDWYVEGGWPSLMVQVLRAPAKHAQERLDAGYKKDIEELGKKKDLSDEQRKAATAAAERKRSEGLKPSFTEAAGEFHKLMDALRDDRKSMVAELWCWQEFADQLSKSTGKSESGIHAHGAYGISETFHQQYEFEHFGRWGPLIVIAYPTYLGPEYDWLKSQPSAEGYVYGPVETEAVFYSDSVKLASVASLHPKDCAEIKAARPGK